MAGLRLVNYMMKTNKMNLSGCEIESFSQLGLGAIVKKKKGKLQSLPLFSLGNKESKIRKLYYYAQKMSYNQ